MNYRKWTLATLLASALVCCTFAEQLMKNPDFEGGIENGKAAGWCYDGKRAQAGYGFGRNFSHGLKYVGDGGAYEWVYQRVPVEAGENYRFEAWVKTENIVGTKGVFLVVTFYTAEGKWKEASASPNISGTSDGWQHLSVDVTPSKKTACAEISIRVSDGETGTFFADDFSFDKVTRPPIKFLVCDAYRSTATGGKVTFKLVSNMTDSEIAAKGWKGEVRLPNLDGTSFFTVTPAPAFTNGVSTFVVDIDFVVIWQDICCVSGGRPCRDIGDWLCNDDILDISCRKWSRRRDKPPPHWDNGHPARWWKRWGLPFQRARRPLSQYINGRDARCPSCVCQRARTEVQQLPE